MLAEDNETPDSAAKGPNTHSTEGARSFVGTIDTLALPRSLREDTGGISWMLRGLVSQWRNLSLGNPNCLMRPLANLPNLCLRKRQTLYLPRLSAIQIYLKSWSKIKVVP